MLVDADVVFLDDEFHRGVTLDDAGVHDRADDEVDRVVLLLVHGEVDVVQLLHVATLATVEANFNPRRALWLLSESERLGFFGENALAQDHLLLWILWPTFTALRRLQLFIL